MQSLSAREENAARCKPGAAGRLLLILPLCLAGCASLPFDAADWRALDRKFHYEGDDLGCMYDPQEETAACSLWAPTAAEVSIRFFAPDNAAKELGVRPMRRGSAGVWRIRVRPAHLGLASLQSVFYQYQVDARPALDPYARSMAEDNAGVGKAALVDMTRPVAGFAEIPGYAKREDAIIYEVHVRDFTVDPGLAPGPNDAPFGTFKAFIRHLPYIRDLGATHIQLLPVMAYFYGDESRRGEREWAFEPGGANYNWGYDPHSYFAPEGMYATDPRDPQARVDELKALIEAIHAEGMGVLLDVVYNHHPHAGILDPIVPGYYYRGRNDSFAGTDIASERAMARKLVVDSLVHWVREYKVDGFRFDLMGLMDQETIRTAWREVSRINPNALFIGEGWRMYKGPPLPMADQDWVLQQDFAAVFSDEIRDLVKSGYNDEGTPRFVSGGKEDTAALFANIKGQPGDYFKTDDPGDAVQYVAAHDNLTLHDVLALATGLDPDNPEEEREIQQRQRLANLLVLTSQGIAFLHAGQEYGRSKRWLGEAEPRDSHTTSSGATFIHNSYDSPDIVNFFDWSKVLRQGVARDTMQYTAGLLRLRRSTDAFRLGTRQRVDKSVSLIQSPDIAATDNAIAYTVRAGDGSRLHIFVNGSSRARSIRTGLDLSRAEVLADAERAGTSRIAAPKGVQLQGSSIRLAPLTAAILRNP